MAGFNRWYKSSLLPTPARMQLVAKLIPPFQCLASAGSGVVRDACQLQILINATIYLEFDMTILEKMPCICQLCMQAEHCIVQLKKLNTRSLDSELGRKMLWPV